MYVYQSCAPNIFFNRQFSSIGNCFCVQSVFGDLSLKSPPSIIFFKYISYIWIFIKYFLEGAIVERRRLLVHNRSSGTWAWNSSLEAETSPTLDFLLISEKYGFQITSIPSTIDLVRGKTTSSKLCSALPKYMILPAMPDNKAFSSCVVKRPLQFLQLRLLHKAVITVYLQMGCVHTAHVNYQKHILCKH